MTNVKICGVTNEEDARQAIACGADYIGFIFYEKSPRYVHVKPKVDDYKSVKKVGVFVNASERTINEKRIQFGLDMIQLHGDERPELCFALKQQGVQVIKAFSVNESFDFHITTCYQDYCDFFLFDTQTKSFGGSGKKFDWRLLRNYNNARPAFLSGGIGPDDVKEIKQIKGLNLKAIDVNSQFETEPAMKNIELLSKFISEVRK